MVVVSLWREIDDECGQVHKKLGNTHLALMNFSYASDLDPKGTNNQIKEAINKHYVTDEDEGN